MWTLYHQWLSPFSRKVRLYLAEKKVEFELRLEPVWERRPDFLALNPAGEVPVLENADGTTLSDSQAIVEFIEEKRPEPTLIGQDAAERAEVRRLIGWFDRKFNAEVTENLVGEKVVNRLLRTGTPDSRAIRAGHLNVRAHVDYVGFLSERRKWLAGDQLTLADITAAAHFSCVDYLGDVPWDQHEEAKNWYARMKSRPSFRPLLGDHIPGLAPAPIYTDMDF
ncbi:MAG: glutathione S-transferase family protein [Rhodospirillales bacterium]|nr:glutathione S-transferase family protein [Rhodospirillales bacterium]